MCVSIAPAEFSGTILYLGEKTIFNKYYNILGYQNTAINLSDSPNAMILHFPTRVEMSENNIVSTKGCKNILKLRIMKDHGH